MVQFICFFLFCFVLSPYAVGQLPQDRDVWQRGFPVPINGRINPYLLSEEHLQADIEAGRLHAQFYPVEITALLPPYEPVIDFIEEKHRNPFKILLQQIFKGFTHLNSFYDFTKWLGLPEYPKESDRGVYAVPYPNGVRPQHRVGLTIINRENALGFTFGCTACHSASLFGKTVLGLTNRFSRANDIFYKVQKVMPYANAHFFRLFNRATESEVSLLKETKRNFSSLGAKIPSTLGLDTSLTQVALSLAKRRLDSVASKDRKLERKPRDERLSHFTADSKPAVWWNVKYKNRWLSDGSIVSGNPIFTNILWNELGRGIDLDALDQWLDRNTQKTREIANAVLNSHAPLITDFFQAELFDLAQVKSGQALFRQYCMRCHGDYEKNWEQPKANLFSYQELLQTKNVKYHRSTPVINVGTDPFRREGMSSLEQLNGLAISQKNQTLVEKQQGYVPPPLVGIWARWPYFHNNSVASLCEILTASKNRLKQYLARAPENPRTDFDFQCNGYPRESELHAARKSPLYYDTRKQGQSNVGHDEGIFLQNGNELLSPQNKVDLILFLQTL